MGSCFGVVDTQLEALCRSKLPSLVKSGMQMGEDGLFLQRSPVSPET